MPRVRAQARRDVTPPRAGVAAACAVAAFAALARTFGLWCGDFAGGALLAATCAGAGLAASRLLAAPSATTARWWSLAAALGGPAFAVLVRLAGLSASDPGQLAPGAGASSLALAPAAALVFFALGRVLRGCGAAGALDAAAGPAAALAAWAALGRLEAPLVFALSTPALLLGAPRRAPALAGLAVAAACAFHARSALRDVWTLRLDHLFAGWAWRLPPAGPEGLGAVRFPDGRVAVLRAGRLEFEDPATARLALLVLLGQCERAPGAVALSRPRGLALPLAARAAGLEALVLDDAPPAADALLRALWDAPPPTAPDPAWAARRVLPASPRADMLLARVGGTARAADRAGVADRRALSALRRALADGAPAAVLLPGQAAPRDVAAVLAAAASAFGHAAVADLPAGVLVVASPRPVLADAARLAERLPLAARMGWDPAPVLAKAVLWRPTGAPK